MTMPDIPPAWIQVIAAFGAILVVILILNWTGKIMSGQGRLGELLINRTYDLVDRIVASHSPPPPVVIVASPEESPDGPTGPAAS